MFQETDKRFKETDEKFKETDKILTEKFQETDRLLTEKFQETDKKTQQTRAIIHLTMGQTCGIPGRRRRN